MRNWVPSACGCLIFAATTCGFASTVLILALDLGGFAAVVTGGTSVLVIFVSSIVLWKYHHQPDLAPDFLAKLTRRPYADADGFCFVCMPMVVGRELRMQIHYQNRYDQPLSGSLRLSPHGIFRKGLPEVGTTFNCGPGEYGIIDLPWAVTKKFSGKKIKATIDVNVEHPRGKGEALRFRLGTPVRPGRTILRTRLPVGFCEGLDALPSTSRVIWALSEALATGFPVDPVK